MSKRNLILTLVVVVTVFATGYLSIADRHNKQIEIPVGEWNTYITESFSFKCSPNKCVNDVLVSPTSENSRTSIQLDMNEGSSLVIQDGGNIEVGTNRKITFREFIDGEMSMESTFTPYSLNSLTGYKYSHKDYQGKNVYQISLSESPESSRLFTLSYLTDDSEIDAYKVLNPILETFEFFPSNSYTNGDSQNVNSIPSTNWRKFQDSHISFMYPDSWPDLKKSTQSGNSVIEAPSIFKIEYGTFHAFDDKNPLTYKEYFEDIFQAEANGQAIEFSSVEGVSGYHFFGYDPNNGTVMHYLLNDAKQPSIIYRIYYYSHLSQTLENFQTIESVLNPLFASFKIK